MIGRVIRAAVSAVIAVAALYFVGLAIFRGSLLDYYGEWLDAWVAGGKPAEIQSEVVGTCGKLVMSQSGPLQTIKFLTWGRDDFDFYVDVCAKMTVNRVYRQPEFEKPELAKAICGPSSESFLRKLCERSGISS